MKSALLFTGIGLRSPHYQAFCEQRPPVAWLEVHSENYFGEGGKALYTLETLRKHYPISLHGVGLSLGSADDLNWQHLKQLRDLISATHPCLISDHLSFSSIHGHYLHELLPISYTEETLAHVVERIHTVQDYLKRQIIIENISSYVRYTHSTISEHEFIREVAKQSGCGILLDVNNVYVTATNFNEDPYQYISAMPGDSVHEIHLAGFSTITLHDKEILIDTHNRPIVPAVWDLYRYTIEHLGAKPTIIEWDNDLPSLETLLLEAYRAEKILRDTYAATKRTG